MKADPSVQLHLLDVQELDSRADTLRHRLGSIPEARQLQELGVRRKEVDDAARDLRIEVADLTAEQKRADADVEQVKARRTRDQGMVDGGGISDPKALERMLGELQSLERRITSLEDTEIEVMERLETAENALAEREAELAEIDARAAELKSALESSAGSLQHDLEQVEAERYAVALDVPDDLRALYEKLRANKGGTGAAALRRRECGGCRLTLNASDLAIIARKPADEVVRCEECDRILVRTEESGL
ncbi:zinc ribbon domain-containing protein [Marmoricola sp. Leaf446]|uniref:zinc ribbon domain-containing protein n=1 Tax=Marmoricola sp. Leaf446 TaxID=1736379 RepID=UPI000AA306FF|nr:C4-type zinc ribbon domain-containing protein [Marmoricola sp. Leaf446]